MSRMSAYRMGVGVAAGAALLLVGLMLTVGVLSDAGAAVDRIYVFVLGVGAVGAALARFEPRGMAYALLATAAAQAFVIPSALASGLHRGPGNSVAEIVGVNGVFVAAFAVAAALLFYAGAQRASTGASANKA